MKRALALLALPLIIISLFVEVGEAASRGAGARRDYSLGRTAEDIRGARQRARPKLYFVKRVVDGDTVRLGDGEKVRLIGVDTPELSHHGKPVQYYGVEASDFTRRQIEKRGVVMDFEKNMRDKYGRLLCYIFRDQDGFFLNAEIIRQGFGYAYTRYPFRYIKEFRLLEMEAKAGGLGLWAREADKTKPESKNIRPGIITKENISTTLLVLPDVSGSSLLVERDDKKRNAPALTNTQSINTQGYLGSAQANKFHYPACMWAQKISPHNMVRFKSREEALKAGYVPCKVCNP